MKRNNNNSNKRRKGRNGASRQNLLDIPKLRTTTAEIQVTKKIRYSEVTAGQTQIDRKDLLNLIVLPDTTTTAYGLLKSCKINRIQCWSIVSTATNPIGIGDDTIITWFSDLGKETVVRGTQMGVAPCYISTSPPKDSLAGYWTSVRSDLTEVLCEIDTGNGSIIDIEYSLIFCNNQTARNFAITTGLVGKVSYNSFGSFTVQGYQNYTPA